MSPSPPRFQGSQPQWTPVPEIQRARVLKYLAVDMAKYTPAFLHANLAYIYIIQTLTFHGRPAGGMVDDTVFTVYLTAPDLRDREREVPHRAGVFHHEFSSILCQRHSTQFPDKAWRRTNPAHFAYESAHSGRRNLYTKLSNTRFNPDLYDGNERNLRGVWRPYRKRFTHRRGCNTWITGDLAERAAIAVHHKQTGDIASDGHKRETGAIGRPGRLKRGKVCGRHLSQFRSIHIDYRYRITVINRCIKRKLPVIGQSSGGQARAAWYELFSEQADIDNAVH